MYLFYILLRIPSPAPLGWVAPAPASTVAAVAAAAAAAAAPLLTDGPTTCRRSFAWRTAGCVLLASSLMLELFGVWGAGGGLSCVCVFSWWLLGGGREAPSLTYHSTLVIDRIGCSRSFSLKSSALSVASAESSVLDANPRCLCTFFRDFFLGGSIPLVFRGPVLTVSLGLYWRRLLNLWSVKERQAAETNFIDEPFNSYFVFTLWPHTHAFHNGLL